MKVELTHDTLAKSIYEKASHDDKVLLKIANFIRERQLYYQESKTLLSKKDLEYIAPYTSKIVLSADSIQLIAKSKTKADRNKRWTMIIIVLANLILLGGIGYITYAKYVLSRTKIKIETSQAKIRKANQAKAAVDRRIDSLINLKQSNAPNLAFNQMEYAQNLVNSYDTLKKVNQSISKDKKIAQSATLSNLATTVLLADPPEEDYAFRLSATAWLLNHENSQAIEVLQELYELSEENLQENLLENTDSSSVKQIILHQKNKRNKDYLSDKEMAILFEKNNKILNAQNSIKTENQPAIPLEKQVQKALQKK
jgi:hypothetical protein